MGGSVGHSEWLGGGDESDCSVGLAEYGPILILIRLGIGSGIAIAIAGDCMANGVIIGRTNRSFTKHNNTLCLSPALITTRSELDEIVDAIDAAITRVTT